MITIDPKVVPLTRLAGLLRVLTSGARYDETCQEEGKDKVIARIKHDMLLGQVYPSKFEEGMSEWALLEIYKTGKYDAQYGIAMAQRNGLTLPKANAHDYDVTKCSEATLSQTVPLRQDRDTEFFVHMRRIGAVSIITGQEDATDGVNHINIYSDGRTEVGRAASNFSDGPYDTPDGIFRTLEGYYHWLRIRDWSVSTKSAFNMAHLEDSYPGLRKLRTVSGPEAIRLGRVLKSSIYGGTSYRTGPFSAEAIKRFRLALATKLHKLRYNNVTLGNYLSMLVYCGFPLTHYYVYNGKVKYPDFREWLPNLLYGLLEHIDPNGSDFDLPSLHAKINEGSI